MFSSTSQAFTSLKAFQILLQKLRPQILHAHEVFSPATTATAARWLLGGTPVVVTAHRSGPIGDVQRLQQKLFGARRLQIFQRQVDKFIVISREIGAELSGVGVPAERQVFIPNGVDTRHFAPLTPAAKQQVRQSLNLPSEALVAIFTGRLAAEKRVNHLINIWPTVRQQHPDAVLLIVGTGPEEAKLKQLAGAGVVFAGRCDDVAPYLQAADVFVLPSVAEGLSVAMLEAMSSGLPAIVTQVGGAADVISPGVNGYLIPPDDVPTLQQAVLTLFQSAELRARLGQAARAVVERDYALPVIARRLRQVYDDLLR